MDADEKVIDYNKNPAEFVRTVMGLDLGICHAGALFCFRFATVYAIGKLSGGVKRRLNLLRVRDGGAKRTYSSTRPTNDLRYRNDDNFRRDYLDDLTECYHSFTLRYILTYCKPP